jgi:hypothetical protein
MFPMDGMPPVRIHLPSSFELAELIAMILSDWAFFSSQPAGKPVEGPAPLHLEFMVMIKGSLNGHLVMRCQEALGEELAHASTGDPTARDLGDDAFRELCSLATGHILSKFFGNPQLRLEPYMPVPSQPSQWPPRSPETEVVVMVGPYPLEVRLWLETDSISRD